MGSEFEPYEMKDECNVKDLGTTELLMKMIGMLEVRVERLEAQIRAINS